MNYYSLFPRLRVSGFNCNLLSIKSLHLYNPIWSWGSYIHFAECWPPLQNQLSFSKKLKSCWSYCFALELLSLLPDESFWGFHSMSCNFVYSFHYRKQLTAICSFFLGCGFIRHILNRDLHDGRQSWFTSSSNSKGRKLCHPVWCKSHHHQGCMKMVTPVSGGISGATTTQYILKCSNGSFSLPIGLAIAWSNPKVAYA